MVSRERIAAYLADIGYPVDPMDLVDHVNQRPSTLCYVTDADQLLMLKRNKEPFAGHWTAPGGKIIAGETPRDAVIREVWEETGLTIRDPVLKAVCSEVGDDEAYNWLLFIYTASAYSGTMLTVSDEGELRWQPLAQFETMRIPDIDRQIAEYIFQPSAEPYFIKIEYATDHTVGHLEVEPLSARVR